jgi:hypothetical protein
LPVLGLIDQVIQPLADAAMEQVFLDIYIAAHKSAPKRIILDLDATDDPLHGHQEGRFFHGYYRCYCYLPLYIFDGRHLLVAKLRKADIDAAAGAKEKIARIVAHVRQAGRRLRSGSGRTRRADELTLGRPRIRACPQPAAGADDRQRTGRGQGNLCRNGQARAHL